MGRTIGLLAILVIAVITTITLALALSQSYFNSRELQSLVDQASARGVGYEVIIHNSWTGEYSFLPIE
ncbi:Uncharacterised protein [Chlamydia trachomatis]|nr:Uncharacterised protein [Chlamydia trachomatis]